MNHYKDDNLKSGTRMNLIKSDNVEHDFEVETDKEDTAGIQSISSAVQPSPDAVKILNACVK